MYIVIVKIRKNNIEINEMKTFKRKFIRFWLYVLLNKMKKREVLVFYD